MITLNTSFSLGPKGDESQRLNEAATRFEAIFARQMLASARKAGFDDGGLFSSQGADTFRQMMDERFADILAESGTLGFGKTIAAQLSARLAPAADANANAETGGKAKG